MNKFDELIENLLLMEGLFIKDGRGDVSSQLFGVNLATGRRNNLKVKNNFIPRKRDINKNAVTGNSLNTSLGSDANGMPSANVTPQGRDNSNIVTKGLNKVYNKFKKNKF